jgi:hypothetical protein
VSGGEEPCRQEVAMDDKLVERMKADRGWLARQMEKVRPFKGYLENTTIWEADKMVREEIARRLTEVKPPVNTAIKAVGEDVRAGKALSALEGLLNHVDRVTNKVRFADYGHSAINAKIKVRAEDLGRLLAADREMFGRLEAVEAAAAALAERGPESLGSALSSFESQFGERKKVLVSAAESGEKEG